MRPLFPCLLVVLGLGLAPRSAIANPVFSVGYDANLVATATGAPVISAR